MATVRIISPSSTGDHRLRKRHAGALLAMACQTSDTSVVGAVKDDLCDWRTGRLISAMDRGFSRDKNLRLLRRSGERYIVGEKLYNGKYGSRSSHLSASAPHRKHKSQGCHP